MKLNLFRMFCSHILYLNKKKMIIKQNVRSSGTRKSNFTEKDSFQATESRSLNDYIYSTLIASFTMFHYTSLFYWNGIPGSDCLAIISTFLSQRMKEVERLRSMFCIMLQCYSISSFETNHSDMEKFAKNPPSGIRNRLLFNYILNRKNRKNMKNKQME